MTSRKNIKIFLDNKPVSASRPRVSSFGTYYSKSYMAYRKEAHKFFTTIAKDYPIDPDGLYSVELEFICYKPKKPSNPNCPRYDLDNLEKATLDAITHAKMIWKDDIQVLKMKSSKRYQDKDEPFGTKIIIKKIG